MSPLGSWPRSGRSPAFAEVFRASSAPDQRQEVRKLRLPPVWDGA
jgi:hypothetical protein